MKRSLFCLAASLFIVLVFSGFAATMASEVRVGHILPLSGGTSPQGTQIKAGTEIATEEINAEGGIKSLGGATIKLFFGDSKSTADGGVAETERLITREKVSIILGAYSSAVTFPSTEVAERYKTPWIVNVASKEEITQRGFKYVFRDWVKTSEYPIAFVNAVELFVKETGKKPETAAILYEGTDWGRTTAGFFRKTYPEKGYKLILDESYPPGITDFTPQILKDQSRQARHVGPLLIYS